MTADSNVAFSDEKPLTSPYGEAGVGHEQTVRAPALAVRLPGVVEHQVERHDRDLARWLGCPFDRRATIAERVFLTARGSLRDPSAVPRLLTRVALRGTARRRTWPMLGGAA